MGPPQWFMVDRLHNNRAVYRGTLLRDTRRRVTFEDDRKARRLIPLMDAGQGDWIPSDLWPGWSSGLATSCFRKQQLLESHSDENSQIDIRRSCWNKGPSWEVSGDQPKKKDKLRWGPGSPILFSRVLRYLGPDRLVISLKSALYNAKPR